MSDNTELLDALMDCTCDAEVKVMDAYPYNPPDPRMRVIFACSGCGKMVSLDGPISKVYDVKMIETVREID